MTQINAIVVDDEPLVRERVVSLLCTHPRFQIVKECPDYKDAVSAMRSCQPHVVFLDIQMPGGSGFDVLDQLNPANPLIIFITAYEQFALKAFEYAAFDYIVKPISAQRFQKTIQRVEEFLSNGIHTPEKQLTILDKGVYYKISCSEVTHIEAADNYVRVFRGPKIYRQRATLKSIFEQLRGDGFIQVHRSFVVNQRHIREIARFKQGDYLIRLSNGRVVPTSKSFRADVQRLNG